MWLYIQRTGALYCGRAYVATGYAGHGEGVNNPEMQHVPNVGPIPRGCYTIGPPHAPVDHLGPLALPLWPAPGNRMLGRFGFFIHGDNAALNRTASNGCIILQPDVRRRIDRSNDRGLVVVAELPAGFETAPPTQEITQNPRTAAGFSYDSTSQEITSDDLNARELARIKEQT